MPERVLVAGAPPILESVRRALPNAAVDEAPALPNPVTLGEADCLLIGTPNEDEARSWRDAAEGTAIVRLLLDSGAQAPADDASVVFAHVGNPGEIRLALHAAILGFRLRGLVGELTGSWAHDARGAVGVARMALSLLGESDAQSPLQKLENGVVRLGWLVERLPSQIALALDLPLAETSASSIFASLDAYVAHLRRIQPRRPIDFDRDAWTASSGSQALVPFAAGLCELAFRLSPARAPLRISAAPPRRLEVSCESGARPAPWNVEEKLDAFELSRRPEAFVPYRLLEAVRLALRLDVPLRVELTERTFTGWVEA